MYWWLPVKAQVGLMGRMLILLLLWWAEERDGHSQGPSQERAQRLVTLGSRLETTSHITNTGKNKGEEASSRKTVQRWRLLVRKPGQSKEGGWWVVGNGCLSPLLEGVCGPRCEWVFCAAVWLWVSMTRSVYLLTAKAINRTKFMNRISSR